jgi:hypothetical protein
VRRDYADLLEMLIASRDAIAFVGDVTREKPITDRLH